MNLSVPSSGSYRVWVRMLSPSTNVNGFYLQIADANACQITMGDAVVPLNAWVWVDYQNGASSNKVNVTLTAGSHQVNLAGLDDGVLIDKVLLLSDTACTPTGDGTNCTSAATGSTPTPTPGGSTPAATPTPVAVTTTTTGTSPIVSKTIAIPLPTNLSNAKCAVDGKSVDCSSIDTTKLNDGEHVVTVTGTDQNGKPVEKSTTIEVKNKLTPVEQIVAGIKKFQWPLIALGVAALSLAGWFIGRHFGLFSRFHFGGSAPQSMSTTGASPAAPAVPTTPAAPSGSVIYPSGSDGPTKLP
jgi:hypothetical protein